MNAHIAYDNLYGNLLWISSGSIEAAASLDYGLRIMVLRYVGMENLLYRQPDDRSDGLITENGWRIYGGHRFWTAPECDNSYYPDNAPVEYVIDEESVMLTQKTDQWTGLQKQLRLTFYKDVSLQVEHILTNCSTHSVNAAAWGITTLKGGGNAEIPYGGCDDGYAPNRVLSLWGDTSLGDSRLSFSADKILARHDAGIGSMKLGIYSPYGKISMRNFGQRLEISFLVHPLAAYPDNGCNVELYLDKHIMELETLGELKEIAPGETITHTEYWRITPELS